VLWLTPLLKRCCLKVLLKKIISIEAFQLTLPDSCTFSPLRFLVANGITDFGIAQAKHCDLVFCSFLLQID